MFQFFRKFRRKLLAENRFTKYLVYAVGEIVLVMIGILLALQVNTWNQNRLDRGLEKGYLKGLMQDLNQDSSDLSKVITKASINIKLCVNVITELGDSIPLTYYEDPMFKAAINQVKITQGKVTFKNYSESVGSFGEKTTQLTQRRSFDLARVTLDNLLATGNLEVIQNEELRTAIQNYYSKMSAELDYESIVIFPAFNSYLNILQEIGLTPYSELPIEHVKQDPASQLKLVNSLKYLLHTNLMHYYWSSQLNTKIETMKKAIEKELAKV